MHRKSLSTVFGVFLFALAIVPGVTGNDNAAKTTYLTFGQPCGCRAWRSARGPTSPSWPIR